MASDNITIKKTNGGTVTMTGEEISPDSKVYISADGGHIKCSNVKLGEGSTLTIMTNPTSEEKASALDEILGNARDRIRQKRRERQAEKSAE